MDATTRARQADPATLVAAEAQQYLTFSAKGEMFALGILNVKEIIEFGTVTQIPMMPCFIRGVINLRGAVVPVIDLRARFGGGPTEVQRRTCIVIVEVAHPDGRQDLGIVVDAVSEVLEIAAAEIEPAPAFGSSVRADFIAGMGKVGGRFVIILDMARVLSVEEMAALTALSAAADDDASAAAPARLAH
ncbi:purine-binding chemotaxis protein CheW [Nitrogeniibacter mangrovi]|uniref:Purine-binding chemotaxis protein CheW n=1 Tax=Nitrogeniibacter mangrovi TaxID=2016596 RepID=A0A6C1AZL9_9RHOO|nr:chemotaxis protein CheW [Nitrogeniibacter mangrovi]QID16806.1 purine-binding chemotaxis protein CheW [Nitrogeniibacter mangrovi]